MASNSTTQTAQLTIDDVVISDDIANSTAIPIQDVNAVTLLVLGSATGVAVTPYVSDLKDGTYYPVYVAANSGTDGITVTQNRAYPVPQAACHANFLKLLGGSAISGNKVILKRV